MKSSSSASIAMATAMLLLAGCSSTSMPDAATTSTQTSLVKCEGVNECKGTSECKGPNNPNGCQGLNDCKGQGWISIPQSECDAKGGKVLSEAAPAPASSSPSAPKAASFKCHGINECKGHSACKSESNACKGQNDCKGKGFLEVPSEAECAAKDGTVTA